MALSDITKEAVELALAEFDHLGDRDFLSKYGFMNAKRYWLVHDGKSYPSKAIAGVAHKFVAGQTLLASPTFTGGEGTVVKKLKQLGYSIEVSRQKPQDLGQNPRWTRDEVVLALNLYMTNPASPPRKESAEVETLSALLNKMHRLKGTVGKDTLRNANGVYLKMMNFRSMDPTFVAQGKAGMSSASELDQQVWTYYFGKQKELAADAAIITAAIENADEVKVARLPTADPYEGEEGGVITRLHKRYERDPKLVAEKRKEAMSKGDLRCQVCKFDYGKSYGELGAGYIEVHHINPLHQLKQKGKTKLSDLALLCANCHRMAHRKRVPLSLDEIRIARNG